VLSHISIQAGANYASASPYETDVARDLLCKVFLILDNGLSVSTGRAK
jgi:hypothetical protein